MQKEVNTALWLRKVWGWRTRKSERYVFVSTLYLSFLRVPHSNTPFHHVTVSFNFNRFSTSTPFNPDFFQFHTSGSPSPAPTIRASDFPRRKTLLQRVLAHFTCSHNIPEVHDEIVLKKSVDEDDDDRSLLIYTARGRGRAEAIPLKLQWQASE